MARIEAGDRAPDFELPDFTGERRVRLSDFLHEKQVLLVFNRGLF